MNSVGKYVEGTRMSQFHRINEISLYNFNYYIGFDSDLLFCKSDDDNTSEWWVINGNEAHYLGESYFDDDELLNIYKTRQI